MTEEVKTVGFSEDLNTEHYESTLPYIEGSPREDTAINQQTYKPKGKFQVDVNDVIDFIFPEMLQHPLAAGRLFCYGMYGPLDENNDMRTGPRGVHKTSVWELDQMCLQVEREDIMAIYTKKRCDIGLLSIEEQESIILQADPKLKKAVGKSMLPHITKEDVYGIFAELPRDADGYYSFHAVQQAIADYREERIKNFKLVYPKITNGGGVASKKKLEMLTGGPSTTRKSMQKTTKRKGKVSSSVACGTMFQFNKGQTNPDIIKQTNSYLSKHAYKISDIDGASESAMTANVRLLREVEPRCPNPFLDPLTGQSTLGKWNDTCNLKGTGMGSKVKAIASSTTWKRNTTLAPASALTHK